jgi:predicted nucleic acid-binding protein
MKIADPFVIADYLSKFRKAATVVEIPEQLTLKINIDDEDDIKFIKCAIVSKSTYILSGDKHLLKLKSL